MACRMVSSAWLRRDCRLICACCISNCARKLSACAARFLMGIAKANPTEYSGKLPRAICQSDPAVPEGTTEPTGRPNVLQLALAVTTQLPCKPDAAYWPKTFPVGSRLLAVYWLDICSFCKFICAVFKSG